MSCFLAGVGSQEHVTQVLHSAVPPGAIQGAGFGLVSPTPRGPYILKGLPLPLHFIVTPEH